MSIGGFKNEWELGYEDAIRANERERAAGIARRIGLDMMEPSTGESIADAILDPNENAEIEITPEMIEAGMNALEEYEVFENGVAPVRDRRREVVAVFRAMCAVRRPA